MKLIIPQFPVGFNYKQEGNESFSRCLEIRTTSIQSRLFFFIKETFSISLVPQFDIKTI